MVRGPRRGALVMGGFAACRRVGHDVQVSSPNPPPSRYSLGSLPNMVRSLVVIGAIVALLIIIVPRSQRIEQPAVDAAAKAAWTAKDSGWPIEAPTGLPNDWKATTATFTRGADSLMTYTAVYQSPSGEFVSVWQTTAPTQGWIRTATNDATPDGTTVIGARTWSKRWQESTGHHSLVLAAPLTIVVTGSGTLDEVTAFAGMLRPVTPAG